MACDFISNKSAKIFLGISFLLILISLPSTVIFMKLHNTMLKKNATLSEESFITEIWKDMPLHIYKKLYFFNITNKDKFTNGLEPLNVTEIGPYTYKSRWVKPDPKWNENNTVSYKEIRTYQFVTEMSIGSEDDKIITLNGPMIIGANVIPSYLRPAFYVFCLAARERVTIQKSIKELAFEGYDDAIIKRVLAWKSFLPYKDGKFCWLYGKNATDDGRFTVYTGVDFPSKTNFIDKWDENKELSFWSNDTCNMLNGTNIETGPQIDDNQDSYTFFQSFFCRSITFRYSKDTKHYGITAKRFKPTYSIFANSTENPDNYCFEVKKERASGLLDLSPCQFGAPVFLSFPHFYLADASLLKSVNGLNPNENKHGSYIDVEPTTGLSIGISLKYQINIEIENLKNFRSFNAVTKGIFPVFWSEISLEIDEDLANFLKLKMRDPITIACRVVLGIGMLCCIVSAIIIYRRYKADDDKTPLINEENSQKVYDSPNKGIGDSQNTEENVNSYQSVNNIDENLEVDFRKNGMDKS